MQNYEAVPDIISTKDLDYLADMFSWNYGALKNTFNSLNQVNNSELKSMLQKGFNLFKENMEQVLTILGGNNE